MKYRVLGRTGLRVSEIGFGAHEYRRPLPTTLGEWGEIDTEQFMKTQPPRAGLIRKALDAGVNFFDTTQTEEAKSVGIVLEELGTRDKSSRGIVVTKGKSSYLITLNVKNTGSADATIDQIIINGKLFSQCTTPALNSTLGSSGTLVATDSSAIVTIGIGSQSVAPFATGTTIELMRALC